MSEDWNGTQDQGGTEHNQQWPLREDGPQGTAPLSMDRPAPGAAGGGQPGPGSYGTPGSGASGPSGSSEPGPGGPGGPPPGSGEIPSGSYGRPGGYGEPGGYGGYGGYGAWGGPPGGYGQPPRRRRRRRFLAFAAAIVVAAGIGAGSTVALTGNGTPSTGVSSNEVPNPHKNTAAGNGGSLNQQAVYNKVEPGVVDITSQLKYKSATAQGTGMVINADGLVLTNNHVIDQATSITATSVATGKTYTARVVGY